MSAVHSAIITVARFLLKQTDYPDQKKNEIQYNIYKTIEKAWDGIGEWKC